MQACFIIVTLQLSDDNNTETERKVLELYNQGKTTREIAKEQRLSLRDIGYILKKNRVNHGIAMIDDDNNKKFSQRKVHTSLQTL